MSWCALLSVGPSSCSRDHSRASAMPLSPMTMMEMPTAASMYVENRSTFSAPLTAKASTPTSAWVDRGRGIGDLGGGDGAPGGSASPHGRVEPPRAARGAQSRQGCPEEVQGPSSGPAEGGRLTRRAHRADPVAQAPVEPRVDGHPPAEGMVASRTARTLHAHCAYTACTLRVHCMCTGRSLTSACRCRSGGAPPSGRGQ